MLIWLGLTRSVIMNSKIKIKIYFETITSTLINRCLMEVLVRALAIYYIGRSIINLNAVEFQSSGLIGTRPYLDSPISD